MPQRPTDSACSSAPVVDEWRVDGDRLQRGEQSAVRLFAVHDVSAAAGGKSSGRGDRGRREAVSDWTGVCTAVNVQPQSSSSAPQVISRDALIAAITTFLSGWDTLDEIPRCLKRELDAAGPRALIRLSRALSTAGADWGYYPRDPLARRIHQVLADRILLPESALHGGGASRGARAADRWSSSPITCRTRTRTCVEVMFHRAGAEPGVRSADGHRRPKGLLQSQAALLEPVLRHDQGAAEQRGLVGGRGHGSA